MFSEVQRWFGTHLQGLLVIGKRENPADEVKMKRCSAVCTVPKICHYDARATAHVDIREIKIHVYDIRQTSVENFSE